MGILEQWLQGPPAGEVVAQRRQLLRGLPRAWCPVRSAPLQSRQHGRGRAAQGLEVVAALEDVGDASVAEFGPKRE